jgi:hypothetical protein
MSVLYVQPPKYDPDTLAQMRRLWEDMPELSASKIGAMLGVTGNVIIGQANRRGWKARPAVHRKRPPRTTVFDRLTGLDVFPPSGSCVYPIGHPSTEGFRFCCAPVTEVGAPYCPDHQKRAWTGTGPAKQREAWENDPERRLKAAVHARKINAGKAQRGAT